MSNRVNVDQLLRELHAAAQAAGFAVDTYGNSHRYPLYACTRPPHESAESAQHIYLSAGIHGDEPAGPLTLLKLLQQNTLPRTHRYTICPCMNPAGLAQRSRENPNGIDLNRDYADFASTEIAAHRDWLHAHIPSLDLALHLHEDWEAAGFYLYELNLHHHRSRAQKILAAARTRLPIETASRIDGHRAHSGLIRPRHIPHIPEGLPEAIYFQQYFGLLSYTLETPSARPLEQRTQGMQAAVSAALAPAPHTEDPQQT